MKAFKKNVTKEGFLFMLFVTFPIGWKGTYDLEQGCGETWKERDVKCWCKNTGKAKSAMHKGH